VRVRLLRILVDEPAGHHQVSADELCLHPDESPQFSADVGVQVRGVDVVRDLELLDTGRRGHGLGARALRGRPVLLVAVPIPVTEARTLVTALEAAGPIIALTTRATTVIAPLEASVAATITIPVKPATIAVVEPRPVITTLKATVTTTIVTALEPAGPIVALTTKAAAVVAPLEAAAVPAAVTVSVVEAGALVTALESTIPTTITVTIAVVETRPVVAAFEAAVAASVVTLLGPATVAAAVALLIAGTAFTV